MGAIGRSSEQWSDLETSAIAKESQRQKITVPRGAKDKRKTQIREWDKHMQAKWGDLLNSRGIKLKPEL